MKIPSTIITLILGITLTLVSLWYGQNHGLMPVAASEDAKQIDSVFNLMMTIATGLFFIVEGVLIYSLFAFRRRKGDQTDGPPIEGNVPLEILWTAIPTVIVFMLAVYSFEVYSNIGGLNPKTSGDVPPGLMAHHHGKAQPSEQGMVAMADEGQVALGIGASPENENITPVVVDVKGIQFAWIFTYPETGIVSGELHIPVNRPVQLNISAGDVLHAVWIPELRLKQDAIPGRDSTLAFISNRVGEYPIICAELCGSYHGGMKALAYVQTEEDFNKWVQENTLAQNEDPSETVALNPATASDGEFLAPYAAEMGVTSDTLAQIHPFHQGM
ncbi:cytochrome c oxidase, subunit II [Gloeothece citriformis PCC 7424]|uniref:Cytochrome c oxidase subunit 2 n=1 Tax=Gloeothece citriformis (strain PCC 7424) TaxID=65393 RepID=B7KL72_GLOC7|nr:cytochrome c oxidase subunit II [Gloeothece citriformis]ACK72444.1 cytochrome c oxidase, subunit II [Gloeothece citriformis PCC 7424]